ncbi:hypothetical protein G4B88_003206 [Cannabis sativa]|uniref:Uncharacterized protein n=1 Tax=Cannabis sativa TaxID=3483 RepID=A0A7J6I507_CANSA|nr:hypothetical protein G4B88_003206 [Cannabis sativa]
MQVGETVNIKSVTNEPETIAIGFLISSYSLKCLLLITLRTSPLCSSSGAPNREPPSQAQVMCYRKLSPEEQIKDLLRKKNFKEAIALVEELECEAEITKNMVSFVHAQVGFLLIFDLRFEEAVNRFLLSDTCSLLDCFHS